MAVYLVTGKLGSGKSLISVGRAHEYLEDGRRVVSNFPIDFAPLSVRRNQAISKNVVEVIPARPSVADLNLLGTGGPREDKAGLLILDECATFWNARTWAGQGRQEVIDWLLHSRKLAWDLLLIVQHPALLDKQIREAICEHLVVCKRMDRLKFLGFKMPRVHVAVCRYGMAASDPVAERWVYRGNKYFDCYSTIWMSELLSASWHCVWPSVVTRWKREPVKPSWLDRIKLRFKRPERPAKPSSTLVDPLRSLPPDARWKAAKLLANIPADRYASACRILSAKLNRPSHATA